MKNSDYSFVFKLHKKIIFVFFIFFLIVNQEAVAQSENKINFSVKNVSLVQALEKLYSENKVNIAFSNSDINPNTKVTCSAENKTIEEILQNILPADEYIFQKIGNQYVILRKNTKSQEKKTEKDSNPIITTDTVEKIVIKTDTIIRIDTLTKVDTLVIHDTVTIFKEAPAALKRNKIKNLRSDIFYLDQRREKGFALQASYSQHLTFYNYKNESQYTDLVDTYEDAIKPSLRSCQISVGGIYFLKRFSSSLDITISSLRHKFNYSQSFVEGGFYRIDTLDTYYTIGSNDTIWQFVTDSVYVPREEKDWSYRDINSFLYLGLQLNVAFDVIHQENVKIYAKAGLGLNYLIYYSGTVIQPNESKNTILLKDSDLQKINLSYNFGVGGRFSIAQNFDLITEINYFKYTRPVVKDFLLDINFQGVGLKLGLIYYL